MITILLWYCLISALAVYFLIYLIRHGIRFKRVLQIPSPAKLHPLLGHLLEISPDEGNYKKLIHQNCNFFFIFFLEGLFKDLRKWSKSHPDGYLLYVIYPYYAVNFAKAQDIEVFIAHLPRSNSE